MLSLLAGKRLRAYSLVEVIVAMTVFGFLATGIMVGTVTNHKLAYEITYQNTAHDIAQGFVNQLRTKSYGSLVDFASGADSIKMSKIETDGEVGSLVTFFINNNELFTEEVLVGDYSRTGEITDKKMLMALTFNVVDVSETHGVPALELMLDYSYTYRTSQGEKTLSDSITTVRAR